MASTTYFVMAGLPLGTYAAPGTSHVMMAGLLSDAHAVLGYSYVTMTGPPGKRVVVD